MPPRAVVVVGTRPEAIKMSPFVRALAASGRFAPTGLARAQLQAERVPETNIAVAGNTAVDALLDAVTRSEARCAPRTLLVTLHRRESIGAPLREIALGLQDFLEQTPDARALWLIHPNPDVSRVLDEVPAARIVAALTTPTSLPG
jgi:UDP-N-acetylglucosamine 2-epimerase (non-hydrolysing)